MQQLQLVFKKKCVHFSAFMKNREKDRLGSTLFLVLVLYSFAFLSIFGVSRQIPIAFQDYLPLGKSLAVVFGLVYFLTGIFPLKEFRSKARAALLAILSWLAGYSWIFFHLVHNPYNITMYTRLYVRYYRSGIMFFLFLLMVELLLANQKKNRLLLWIQQGAAFFLTFFLQLCPLVYVGYFMKYRSLFDDISLLSILATNVKEAGEYLRSMFSGGQLAIFACGLLLLLAISWKFSIREPRRKILYTKLQQAVLVFFVFVMFFTVAHKGSAYFPLDVYVGLHKLEGGPMYAFDALKKNIRKNQQQISLDKEKALPMKLPGTVILVVGETACRDYMAAFNPEYPLETTPWESSIRRTDGFFFFPQAYSNFSNTVMALSQSLTSSNQYNNMPLGESVDLVSLAKKAGYHTYWFSTQGKGEVWDAAITTLASQADTRKWMPWKHDGQLLELLKMVPADQNNFIVLHLNGSHYRYRDRVPKKFAQDHTFSQVPKEEGEFDTSLAYTDEVLQQVYQYSHKHLNLQVMVYFSDHGENMKYKHVSHPFTFDMVRIPMWIYLSPAYRRAYPATGKALQAHENTVFTNDLIFETVCGLIQAPSNHYNPQYDLSHPAYAITKDTAKTMRGEYSIQEDPIWEKKTGEED